MSDTASFHPAGYVLPTTDARGSTQQLLACDTCQALVLGDSAHAHASEHARLNIETEQMHARWRDLEIELRRLGAALLELGIKIAHQHRHD
jgi:hypothetical protein